MRFAVVLLIAAAALGCGKAEPRDPKPAAPTQEAAPPEPVAASPADSGASAPATHPGTIVFVDAEGKENVRPVTEVPESVAWATVGGQRVPVVRVVKHEGGGRIEIVSYGPDGQELARVLGR